LDEGWYLMSVADLELELRRWREPGAELPASGAVRLDPDTAISYRDAGNIPDDEGRSLRLVLHVGDEQGLRDIDRKRLMFEPDFHAKPAWRRAGSMPVNVVPLRTRDFRIEHRRWIDDPEIAELEQEWRRTGRVGGIAVDGELRSFVFKTVVSLRRADQEVTREAILDSAARWLSTEDLDKLSEALG
jgi:hypothetical protein